MRANTKYRNTITGTSSKFPSYASPIYIYLRRSYSDVRHPSLQQHQQRPVDPLRRRGHWRVDDGAVRWRHTLQVAKEQLQLHRGAWARAGSGPSQAGHPVASDAHWSCVFDHGVCGTDSDSGAAWPHTGCEHFRFVFRGWGEQFGSEADLWCICFFGLSFDECFDVTEREVGLLISCWRPNSLEWARVVRTVFIARSTYFAACVCVCVCACACVCVCVCVCVWARVHVVCVEFGQYVLVKNV